MRKVLFLPLQQTSWSEMLPLAREVRKNADVVFLIDTPYMLGNIHALLEEGMKYFITIKDEDQKNNRKHISKNIIIKNPLKKILKKSSKLVLLVRWILGKYQKSEKNTRKEYQHTYSRFKIGLQTLRELFDQEKFDVCVVYGDRHISGCELPLLKVCQEKNIPAIIPPIVLAAEGETLAWVRNSKRYSTRDFPSLAEKFPDQVWNNPKTGEGFFFYPVGVMQALFDLKILPDKPWVLGGSASTNILVDGERDKQRLMKQGCPEDKIIITGNRSHDDMYELLSKKGKFKQDLASKYGFSNNKKILIIALPQWVENSPLDIDQAWSEINYLCEKVTSPDWNTLISLHPKMECGNYKFLESKYNLILIKDRLADVLPVSDLFVSTFSSTVRWAVLCGIPAIVVDYHGEQFSLFDGMDGVLKIHEKSELQYKVYSLLEDKELYMKYAIYQKQSSAQLSPFDGLCTKRIVTSIVNAQV